ncbi:MAG: putative phage abortive infection protein [Chlorobiales bacterium]|nr:putative phage abortive infection protein [Chlorobiales bacterium]
MAKKVEKFIEDNLLLVLVFLFLVSLVSYLGVFLVYYLNFQGSPISTKNVDWGAFGDFVGGILNPFFGFMAFIALIVTLHIQWRSNKNQSVENKFFQLLTLHHEIVSGIRVKDEKTQCIYDGRDCFKYFYSKVDPIKMMFPEPDKFLDRVSEEWESIYNDYSHYIGHYFRNLYHIVRFVHRIDNKEEKERYIKFLRAQLSVYEMVLLFFNGLSEIGAEFKPMIEKYALLKNLPPKELRNLENYLFLYAESAYGDLPQKYTDISFVKNISDEDVIRKAGEKAWRDEL